MNSEYKCQLMEKIYPESFLMEIGAYNGLVWQKDEDDSVTWSNFRKALIEFLDKDSELDLDMIDANDINSQIDLMNQLKDINKKYMIPHIKAVIQNLQQKSNDSTVEELLPKAYELLNAYGGPVWNAKLNLLNFYNTRISDIKKKINDINVE